MWKDAIRLALAVSFLLVASGVPAVAAEVPKVSTKAVELRLALRDLWVDHIFWERNAALTTSLGQKSAIDVADERVVLNARALADSLEPYYGSDVADRMFGLLAAHYTAVKEYLTAARGNDAGGKDAANVRLMRNAEDIAAFMGSTNRNWVKRTLASLFTAHAGHHMAQIDNFMVRNYTSEARVYQEMKKHVYLIADIMAAGIVKEFPRKF